MATERVSRISDPLLAALVEQQEAEKNWRPKSESDPYERFDTKLHHAEMLAHCISGSEEFENTNRVIRMGVLWLLADLITEAREAKDEAEAIASAKKLGPAPKEAA